MALLLFAAGCGDSKETLQNAERLLGQGALERAEYLLRDSKSEDAKALLQRAEQMRMARAQADQDIARILADQAMDTEDKREALTTLRDKSKDPVARERMRAAVSQLADQAFASGGNQAPSSVAESGGQSPTAATLPAEDVSNAAPSLSPADGRTAAPVKLSDLDLQLDVVLKADNLEQAALLLSGFLAQAQSTGVVDGAPEAAVLLDRRCLLNDLEARLALRRELLAVLGADARPNPADVADLPSEFLSARQLRDIPWNSLLLNDFLTASKRVSLSNLGQTGLLYERMRLSWGLALEEALRDLHASLKRGAVAESDVHWHLARLRDEPIPPLGYLFENGHWVAKHGDQPATAPSRAQLRAQFLIAGPAQRDAALAALRITGDLEFLRKAVLARWERNLREIRTSRVLPQLAKLADDRRTLDEAREAALALIGDQKAYFFPCDPPDPPRTRAQYGAVQKKVETLTEKVRKAWASERKVRLPESFRTACEDLAWVHDRNAEYFIEAPLTVPSYVLALDPTLEEIGLRNFAWHRQELLHHRNDRELNQLSEMRKKSWRHEQPAQAPQENELQLVRLTNEYRQMFGKPVLAWSPPLHVAASVHADFIAKTGVLAHLQTDPKARSPLERMQNAGHAHGAAENLAGNVFEPQDALAIWLRSSGQHRNILETVYTEVGVARTGLYWVQNFGKDPNVLSEPVK